MRCKYKGYKIFVTRGVDGVLYQISKDKFFREAVVGKDVPVRQMFINCKSMVDDQIQLLKDPCALDESTIPVDGM